MDYAIPQARQQSIIHHHMKEWQTYKQISERFSYNPYNRLGGGSFGTVYKGYDAEMERYIAVKHITRGTLVKSQGQIREVAIMNELQHPNILQCFGMEGNRNSPDGIFIFLELCEKRTLKELIAQKMTELRVYEIFRQLVDGMVYINKKGIFHRDLKPQNLLITANDQLKIADFGIARQIKKGPITFQQGTFQYSAPEAFVDIYYDALKGQYNQKCDVFSAGYVLFEMLTGERINKDIKDQLIFFKSNKGYVIDHPALIQKWKGLIEKMLQFNMHKRPTFSEIREIMFNFQAPVDILPAYRSPSQQQKQQSSHFLAKIKQLANLMLKRNNYYINILKAFHSYQEETSEIAPRIYKILLLFYSLSQYCCLSEDLLKLIDNRREFVLMDIKQSIAELEKRLVISDKANLNKCLREIYIKANKGKEEMKLFLLINVAEDIQKIQELPAKSPEKVVLAQFKVLMALRSWKQNGEYQHIPTYEDGMTRCVNNMYQTTQQLHNLSIADLRIYLTTLYVSNLPCFIRLTEYSKSQPPPSFQQILAMSSDELITQILIERQRQPRSRI